MKAPYRLYTILILLLIATCGTPTESEKSKTIDLTGRVLNNTTRAPMASVIVRVLEPKPEKYTVTDSLGRFGITIKVDSLTQVKMQFSAEGFATLERTFLAIPEQDVVVTDVLLDSLTDPGGDVDDGGEAGEGASIRLITVSNASLSVSQTGGVEQSVLTFVVTDSTGRPLDLSKRIDVTFTLGASPGGGESLNPATATTNAQGRVSTTLTSGTISGVVQVVAEATNSDGVTQRSKPVSVTISGGLPDQNHFSIKTDGRSNYRFNNGTSTLVNIPITAFVGDRYGNFVSAGTPIYFTTNGGNIGANASTDASGQATTTLTPVNPYPTHTTLGAGFATIRARTADGNNQTIETTKTILFSDNTVLSSSRDALTLTRGGTETVTYTVSDQHGNPLVEGTRITVAANNPIMTLNGHLDVTLGDTQAKGAGTTQFSFTASYPADGTEAIEATNVVVTVVSPNGNATKTITQPKIFAGAAGGVGGSPASITLLSVSHSAIVVRESGGVEQSVLTFVVRDSSGKAIDLNNAIEVDFSLLVNPGGTAVVFPLRATTDEQGRVTTTITSGTTSGVVQVGAQATRADGLILRSNPASVTISGGLPDQNHFSIKTDGRSNYRFNNGTSTLVNIPITAFVGDRYSNFVSAGTPIYFTTNGGNIGANASTDASGQATTTLTPVNPYPTAGLATVRARTVDWTNQSIETTLNLMFSDNTTITAPVSLNLTRGGSETVSYTVADQHGNPLVSGTTITVTTSNETMVLNGQTDVTLGDSRTGGAGITTFSFTASYPAAGTEAIAEAQVLITVTSPNGNRTHSLMQPAIAEGATGGTGGAAVSITLESISNKEIRVKETGGVEQTTLTFRVRDAQGNPIDLANQINVDFSAVVNPGGGIQIFPLSATTDDQGRVSTTLTSGTVSGVVQVRAQHNGPPILRSTPVQIVIHAGLPDASHFSVNRTVLNMPGDVVYGLTNTITAFVGDRYGNPVENGTAVYFTTNGGIIQGAGFTENGITSSTLTTAAPFPSAVHPTFGRSGYATIRARTADWNNQSIEATTTILFSSTASIDVTSGAVINVTHGPGQGHRVEFTVADGNGNPLAPGTTITVTVEGQEIKVIGDVNITLPDVMLPGQGITQFSFTVSDENFDVDAERPVQVTIKVAGQNGNVTRTLTGSSFKSKPGQ